MLIWVLHLQNEKDKIGTITHDYDDYHTTDSIGMGGFGRVYKHLVNRGTSQHCFAVKEEKRKVSS